MCKNYSVLAFLAHKLCCAKTLNERTLQDMNPTTRIHSLRQTLKKYSINIEHNTNAHCLLTSIFVGVINLERVFEGKQNNFPG